MTDVQTHLARLAQEPSDLGALKAVESAYATSGRWEELLRVYETQALRCEKKAAAALLHKAAMVGLKELGSPQLAESYLRRALEASPTDLASLQTLRQVYLGRGDFHQVVDIYERELARTNDPRAKMQGLVALADIYRAHLGRLDKALNALKQAERSEQPSAAVQRGLADVYIAQGRLDLAQAALLEELRIGGAQADTLLALRELANALLERPRLHPLATGIVDAVLKAAPGDAAATQLQAALRAQATNWQSHVAELEARAKTLPPSSELADAWTRVAEMQVAYGKNQDAALGAVDRAFTAVPAHPAALGLLEDIYGDAKRYNELVMKLEMIAAYTRSPVAAIELYLKAAVHNAVHLSNVDASTRLYKKVLQLDPSHKVASNALAELLRGANDSAGALRVLQDWAERATLASDKIAALQACCRILEDDLQDRAGALAHYETILALDPDNAAAAQALEPGYRAANNEAALARALRAKLSGIKGDARIPVLQELAALVSGPLNDAPTALTFYGEIYQGSPTVALLTEILGLVERTGHYESMGAIVEGGLDRMSSDTERVLALQTLAAVFDGPRETPNDALRVYRRILTLAPQDPAALAATQRLLDQVGKWEEKAAFYREQAAAATTPAAKVPLLKKLATEVAQNGKDPVQALDVWREVLKLAPDDVEAIDAALSVSRRDSRWAEVVDLLGYKLRSATGAARRVILLEQANLLESRLSRIDEAIELYLAVLAAAPGDTDAFHGLERLLPHTHSVGVIAATLEPIYRANKNWLQVAQMLELRVLDADDAARVVLLMELGSLYFDALAKPDAALRALTRAFQADPSHPELPTRLETLSQAQKEGATVARLLRSAAGGVFGDARVRVLCAAARLMLQHSDSDGACRDYLSALGVENSREEPALTGITAMLQGGYRLAAMRTVALDLTQTLDALPRVTLWRHIARLCEQMKTPEEQIAAWKQVLVEKPGDPEATAELDKLFMASTDPAELVTHLRGQIDLAADAPSKAAYALQLADTLETRLNDMGGAVSALLEAVGAAPDDRAAWKRLAILYRSAGDAAQAAQAMQRELALSPEGPERTPRLLDYAILNVKDLGDIPSAVGALREFMTQDPVNAQAISLLEELQSFASDPGVGPEIIALLSSAYHAAGKWQELVNMLGTQVDAMSDAAQRITALKDIASIKSTRLNDAAGAYSDLERAFREKPEDAGLRLDLEKAAAAGERWSQLAEAYGSALGQLGDTDDGKSVRRKLAEVLDKRLGRAAEAVEHYKALSGGALPDDLGSLESMERLLRSDNRPTELAEVLAAIVTRVPQEQTDRRKQLFFELGALCADALSDKVRAVEYLQQGITLDPKHADGLRRLARLLQDLGQEQELVPVLDKLIELGPVNANIVDDLIARATLMLRINNSEEAFKSFRAALLKKREHAPAVEGLEQLVDTYANRAELVSVLEPIYTARQDHAKLAWVLEKKLDATTELVGRKSLIRRIGDIYENRLNQKEQAFNMARRSLSEDPADMGVRMWIEKLAGETGALRELADAYVDEGLKAQAPLNLQFYRRAAALFHEKLNDMPAAVRQYQAILEAEPRDEKALSGLEAIFRGNSEFGELVEVLKKRVAITAGLERKRELLNEVAKLQMENLGDAGAAVATLRELLLLTPDDAAPFGKIEELLGKLFMWDDLSAFYETEITRLAEKRGRDTILRRLEVTYRRARIIDEQFMDREAAAKMFEAILTEEPTHASTLKYLEERAQAGAFEAIRILETVYRNAKNWQKYVELLENKLTQTAETSLRRDIYLHMSEVYDTEIKEGSLAFMAATRAYNENRADLPLLELVEKIAEKYSLLEDLAGVLAMDIDAVPDFKLRQHLLHRLGHIYGNQLGQTNEAIEHLQHALQYDPSDEEALSALDALLVKNSMWAALADVLERRIEVATETTAKSQLLERLASVWGDQLMDAEAALRCHKQILDIDPDHPLTLKSMQKLYAEVEDWDNLAANLARQAEVLKEPEDQIRIHAAAGQLFMEEMGDNNRAIEHWQKVADLKPDHEDANQGLNILLTTEERWEELATLYRKQLAFTMDPGAKLEINRRLGVILGEKLGRREDALGSWLKVLEQDAKNTDALRALQDLYSERAMWTEFVAMAKRLVPLVDPTEAKEVRFALAKALGENLGQRDDAIRLAREVRATEPHTVDQLARLGDMLCNIQAWDEAVIALEKAAALDEDAGQKVQRYYESASIFRDKLNKPNEARNAYESIIATTPEDMTAYSALADIYRATSEWRKLVALNDDFLARAPADLRLGMLTEIRDVQDGKLGEKDMAFIAACRVYKEDPNSLPAAEILERIAVESGNAEELNAVLEDEIDHIVDSEIKIASLRRIARLYAETVKDLNAAEATLNRILEISPADMEALDMLAELGARDERFDKQIAALERKFNVLGEEASKKNLLLEIGRIWEDRIGEPDEAINALQRVLKIDGVDQHALNELARIYQANARWTELAHTLTRKVELAQDPVENVALRMRVAGLCETELKDPEAAIQWYRGVLEFEPGHTNALASLERLYTGFERWSELIQIFETQVTLAPDTEEKIKLLTKMASIYENEFNSLKDAAACFERMFEIDNKHVVSIKTLERLLRQMGEWNRLIEVLQHHATLVADSYAVTELFLEIGEIYYKDLSRVDKAEQTYNKAREVNPKSAKALHALGKLYERSGNWFQALEMMQKEADLLGNNEEALPVLTRIGRINEDMLSDRESAKKAFQAALAINSSYPAALEALKEIAKSSEDWENYAEHLITEAETSDDPEQKTDLFAEAAKFFQQVRDDEANAIRFYQRALQLNSEHPEASRNLADIYFRSEIWEEARDLYLIVVKNLDKGADPKDFCQKNYRLGYISEKLGEPDKSLAYYKQAFDADATYLPALEGLGQALLVAKQWDEAQKVFQTVLIHHRDSLTESEVVDIQAQLGEICLNQGQPDRAYKQYEKALEVDPDHPASLKALSELDQSMGNWEHAYARMSRYADVAPGPERVPTFMLMSQIAHEKLGDVQRSIEALERARRLGNPPLDLLEVLGNAYLTAQQAAKAAEVLEQAAGVAEDLTKKSELNFQLGQVYETQLKNEPVAVQKYNEALDAAAINVKAFERIERLLAQRQEWALLESNYRAMIQRAKDLSPAIRVVLWRSLAELYRQVLRNVDSAIMAYEVIQKLDPGKPQDVAVLAELYALKPDNRSKAIEMQHDMLAVSDNPVVPIRTLRTLYHAQRDFDAVLVLCNALAFLKEADEEERKLIEYLARGVPPRAARGISDDQWKYIFDPGLFGPVGQLAATLFRTAPDFVTVPGKDLGLKKKEQLDVRNSELYFANMVRYVAGALNLPPVDVFRKAGSMDPLRLVNAQPPALVAGENNDIFRDAQQRLVLFHIGRNMAYARPELFLGRMYVGAELRDLLIGLCIVYNRSLQHNGDPREVEKWATAFEKLPPAALKRLQAPAQAAFADIIKGPPLAIYAAAVERVAARVGLIAAGDLVSAARGVTEGGDGASMMPVRDRIRELVLFSVSRQYLEIRKIMGAALVEGKAAG